MAANTFFRELQRRNVIKAAVTYLAVAWVILQAASIIFPTLNAPDSAMRYLLISLIVLLPAWLIFAWVYEYTPQGFKKTDEVELDESIVRDTSKRMNGVIIASLVLAVLLLLADRIFHITEEVFDVTEEKIIAVLPFKNDSPNNENQYFCDGMMDAILNHLSKIPDLHVISRTSVEQYRNNPPSIKEIAKLLGANYILEGSVLRFEERAQITAQLIYAPDDKHLWSEQYDADLADIFTVLASVTKTIAGELKARISPELSDHIEEVPTDDIKAYDYYLQGRSHIERYFTYLDEEDLNKAELLFRLGFKLDTTFALSYIGLGEVYWSQNIKMYLHDNFLDSVGILCDKALILDPNVADGYALRGAYKLSKLNNSEALVDLKKAIKLNPNHSNALHLIADTNIRFGNLVEGFRILQKLENIDRHPDRLPLTFLGYSQIHTYLGDWVKAEENLNIAKRINPLFHISYYEILLASAQGRYKDALEIIISNQDTSRVSILAEIAVLSCKQGEYDFALRYFDKCDMISSEVKTSTNYYKFSNYYRYGQALLGSGSDEEGTKNLQLNLERLAQRDPKRPFAEDLYALCGGYSFLGDRVKAFKYLIELNEIGWHGSTLFEIREDSLFHKLHGNRDFEEIINNAFAEKDKVRQEIARLEAAGKL